MPLTNGTFLLRIHNEWYALRAEAYHSFNSTLFAYLGNYVLLSGVMQPRHFCLVLLPKLV
jgi:hypothetical protein